MGRGVDDLEQEAEISENRSPFYQWKSSFGCSPILLIEQILIFVPTSGECLSWPLKKVFSVRVLQ